MEPLASLRESGSSSTLTTVRPLSLSFESPSSLTRSSGCPSPAGAPVKGDVERAVWLADSPRNTAENMPDQLPPRLDRKVSKVLEETRAAGAGPEGPVDFWKWANGRLAEDDVKPRVPSPSFAPAPVPALQRPPSFDLEGALEHCRQQLPEVS